MAMTVAKKFRIREGNVLMPINEPKDFRKKLEPLPANVKVADKSTDFHQVHWFVQNRAQLEKELNRVLKMLKNDVICWIYYPKGSSKIQTDLTRDKGWDALMKHADLQWISLVSFDDTWSAFGFRKKTAADAKRESSKKPRVIFDFIDPEKKIVLVPDDLKTAFAKNNKAACAFEALPFSHKKEYVEWIVTAKKEETRQSRIKGTIERLEKGWKNPRNQ